MNLYEYALGGIRTHEIETYTRLEDNLIRHRGDRIYLQHSAYEKYDDYYMKKKKKKNLSEFLTYVPTSS